MVSDSSNIITRAVLLSLLFHSFVLILMSFYLNQNPPVEVFPKIKVYFSESASEESGTVSEDVKSIDPKAAETVKSVVKEAVSVVENLIPPRPEAEKMVPVDLPVFESQQHPETQNELTQAVEPEPEFVSQSDTVSDIASDLSSSESETLIMAEDGEAAESIETAAVIEDSTPGNSDKADLEWVGGSADFKSIPEANFDLPYGAILHDEILITFEVQSDGTVQSIRILPPGSGHLNLDRQIRTYVNSFIFETFAFSEEDKKGILRLRLHEMEAGGL